MPNVVPVHIEKYKSIIYNSACSYFVVVIIKPVVGFVLDLKLFICYSFIYFPDPPVERLSMLYISERRET